MALTRARAAGRWLPWLLLIAACGADDPVAPEPSWIDTIVAEDVVFTGEPVLRERYAILRAQLGGISVDNPEQALERLVDRFAQRAVRRVRKYVDEEIGRVAAAFLRTEAGQRISHAERILLANYPCDFETFAASLDSVLTNAESVGQNARARIGRLMRDFKADPDDVSALAWSLATAGIAISPQQAAEARAFYQSDLGVRWLATREQSYERMQGVYQEVHRVLNPNRRTLWSPLPNRLPRGK